MSTPASAAACRVSKSAGCRNARGIVRSRGIHATSSRSESSKLAAENSGEGFQKPVAETPPSQPPSSPHRRPEKQSYPLYPSVAHLLRLNNIPLSSAHSIPATGPAGRLLKGDVLAYLGRIQKGYSKDQSSRITALGHLDVKNYQKATAPPKPETKPAAAAAPPPVEAETDTQIALPVSLTAVLQTQARIQQSLGLTLPLSTFIARASEIANQDLPRARGKAPTADELFNAVLGLDRAGKPKTERGMYAPQITALPPSNAMTPSAHATRRGNASADIIDILTRSPQSTKSKAAPPPATATGAASPSAKNIFSVAAKKGEEKRARTYLERVKTVLEAEPGRCVL